MATRNSADRNNTPREFFSAEEVGREMFVSRRTVYKLLANGTIPGRKIGNKWYVSRKALYALLGNTAA